MWIFVVLYIIYCLPLYIVANKSGEENAWLAFVPIANLWLMCEMNDASPAWILLIFLPVVGAVIFQSMMWWGISQNANKPGWLGLLMNIPVVDLFVGYYIALADNGNLVA